MGGGLVHIRIDLEITDLTLPWECRQVGRMMLFTDLTLTQPLRQWNVLLRGPWLPCWPRRSRLGILGYWKD